MNYEVGQIIELNGKKNIVLTMFNDNGINYLFVNTVLDDESNITEEFYLLAVNPDNTYKVVTDENEVNRLFPKVQEGLKNSLQQNGIDLNN
ncbi:MAG: hypothetical protein K6C11_00960 [Bacilli bacterium]|nr:hypothetical protein [Bacilli bacterium]